MKTPSRNRIRMVVRADGIDLPLSGFDGEVAAGGSHSGQGQEVTYYFLSAVAL